MALVDAVIQKSKEESNEEYVELLSKLANSFKQDAQAHRDLAKDTDVSNRNRDLAVVIHHVSTGNSALTGILARLLQNQIALEKKIDKIQSEMTALKQPKRGYTDFEPA